MTDASASLEPETEPGIATAEEGVVLLDGPDGIAMTLTADCAARTGQRLIEAAAAAERQKDEAQDV
jgi:hypothetical protein